MRSNRNPNVSVGREDAVAIVDEWLEMADRKIAKFKPLNRSVFVGYPDFWRLSVADVLSSGEVGSVIHQTDYVIEPLATTADIPIIAWVMMGGIAPVYRDDAYRLTKAGHMKGRPALTCGNVITMPFEPTYAEIFWEDARSYDYDLARFMEESDCFDVELARKAMREGIDPQLFTVL